MSVSGDVFRRHAACIAAGRDKRRRGRDKNEHEIFIAGWTELAHAIASAREDGLSEEEIAQLANMTPEELANFKPPYAPRG